ncbi:MAG: nodulation protein NfeD, partial [Verrucomicrobia bacterium]|nr:nodulation protein NfeD [Verrucomicrobiota bacterium]
MRSAILIVACWFGAFATVASGERATVCLSNVDGAIGPATASYISRSIDEAQSKGAQCLIIQLNTPGGLLDSTRVIVQRLLGTPIPVIVYVAPTGATAASAGCFITLAANVAAMAPATTIGAAHPVALGGFSGTDQAKPDQTMSQKLENFAVSYMEAIANRRSRNVEWAKSAVRESASITAEKALELKVIEIIAPNLNNLLSQLNGRIIDGHPLRTAEAKVVDIKMSAAEQFFQMFWRPEVMFVLMLIAI